MESKPLRKCIPPGQHCHVYRTTRVCLNVFLQLTTIMPNHKASRTLRPGKLSQLRRQYKRPPQSAKTIGAHGPKHRAFHRSSLRSLAPIRHYDDSKEYIDTDLKEVYPKQHLKQTNHRVENVKKTRRSMGLRLAYPFSSALRGTEALDISSTLGALIHFNTNLHHMFLNRY